MKVKGDGSCLHRAIATNIMSCCFDDVWAGRFPPGKKPGIKPTAYEVVNDLKQFTSQKDNALLEKIFGFYTTEEFDESIKEKIVEWDFAMTMTEMNKEHKLFGGDFEILLMSINYKMPIIIFQNDSKGWLLVTNTESFYSTYELGDPPARVQAICNLYLLSYYCPMNPSFQNEFNHYMYLAVQDRKSANPFVSHVMSAEWDQYFYEEESFSVMQPKEMNMEKVDQVHYGKRH